MNERGYDYRKADEARGGGSRQWASSERMVCIEVNNLKIKKHIFNRTMPPTSPTDNQVEYLEFLGKVCRKVGIPCDREIEISKRTKYGASGAIKKLSLMLRQRGYSISKTNKIYNNRKEKRDG